MKSANIAELKNHLSAYIAEVKRGGEVIVRERNRPVAKLVPIRNLDDYDLEEQDLVARGVITLPKSDDLPESFYKAKLPRVKGNRGMEVILEERYED